MDDEYDDEEVEHEQHQERAQFNDVHHEEDQGDESALRYSLHLSKIEENDQHVNFDEARTSLAKSDEETALDCVGCPAVHVRTADMEANTDTMDDLEQKDVITVLALTEWTGIKGILPPTVEWKVTLLFPMKSKASPIVRWEASGKEFRKVWGYFDGASRDKLNANLLTGSGRPPGCSTNLVYSTLLKRKY
jgi:hypothetical protein